MFVLPVKLRRTFRSGCFSAFTRKEMLNVSKYDGKEVFVTTVQNDELSKQTLLILVCFSCTYTHTHTPSPHTHTHARTKVEAHKSLRHWQDFPGDGGEGVLNLPRGRVGKPLGSRTNGASERPPGFTRRPACCRNWTARWRRPAGRTWGS